MGQTTVLYHTLDCIQLEFVHAFFVVPIISMIRILAVDPDLLGYGSNQSATPTNKLVESTPQDLGKYGKL